MSWAYMIIGGAVLWLAFIGVSFIVALVIFAARKSKTEVARREQEREAFRKAVIDSVMAGIKKENDKFRPPKGPVAS